MEKKLEEIIKKYKLEMIDEKNIIGFEYYSQAEDIKDILGGNITYYKKKAGQQLECTGGIAFGPFKLEAKDIDSGYLEAYGKMTTADCSAFLEEMHQCLEMYMNDMEDAEEDWWRKATGAKIRTLIKVMSLYNDMSDNDVLLLGEEWASCDNYKIIPLADMTTMAYAYDSTSYAIGLQLL